LRKKRSNLISIQEIASPPDCVGRQESSFLRNDRLSVVASETKQSLSEMKDYFGRSSPVASLSLRDNGGCSHRKMYIPRSTLFKQKVLGNGLQLHIGRAFINLSDFSVTVEFFHRVFFGKSIATVNFYHQRSYFFSHARRE